MLLHPVTLLLVHQLAAEEGEDQVDAEYTGTHAQLAHAATAPKDALAAAVPNAPVFFVKSLVALSQRNPGKVQHATGRCVWWRGLALTHTERASPQSPHRCKPL